MSTTNMLGDLFNKQTNTPEPNIAPENKSNSENLLQGLFPATQTNTVSKAATETTTAPNTNLLSDLYTKPTETQPENTNLLSDIFNRPVEKYADHPVLTPDEVEYAKKPVDEMADEPWYSKAWEWANSPLYDLHKWGTREGAGTFEKGLETGLEDIGSNLITPLQLGLTIATFGGGAVEEAGIAALRAVGVSKLAAPIVASGAKALMTAGFSAQMLGGLMTQVPQFLDALKDGDTENATRLGTNVLASGAFLTAGLKHGYEDLDTVKNYVRGKNLTTTERLALVKELSGIYDEGIQKGTDNARARAEEITAQLKAAGAFGDEITEAGIRHYITQNGDLDRINKMAGIAEGTIKPREWTPEEKAQQENVAELRKWADESSPVTKSVDGAPLEFFTGGSAKGTEKLGQTLLTEGKPEDAHYIQMKNPYPVSNAESLARFIEQAGGQDEAKKLLQDRGYDGIVYDTTKDPKFVVFNNDQFRPKEQYAEIHNAAWSRDHAYIAVDKKNLPKILNQGIGLDPKRNNVQYHATPELALDNATQPDSGNKADLVVLSVPRDEVEQAAREANAAVHAQTNRGVEGPVEVLPRVNRTVPPTGSGKMFDKAGEIVTPEEGYEKHTAMSGQFKKRNQITSDREVHAHEMAHSLWAQLGGLPIGDILNHLHEEATKGKGFVGSAEIGLHQFMSPVNGEWRWIPENITAPKLKSLIDSMMAGTVADKIVSGVPYDEKTFLQESEGNSDDIKKTRDLLRSKGIKDETDQNDLIRASLDSVSERMKKYGIDAIIKQEFARGREPGLPQGYNYSSDRLLKIGNRVKDAINGLSKRSAENANPQSVRGTFESESARAARERNTQGAPRALRTAGEEGERPPVNDEDLIVDKRLMPGHLLEMEEGKNAKGETTVRATGRSTPLRPLGAEDLPGNAARFNNEYTPAEKQKYIAGLRAASHLTDEQIQIAKTLRSLYDASFQNAYEKGMIRSWIEAYHPQAWADQPNSLWHKLFNNDPEPVTNEALNDLRHSTQSGHFDTNINQARHRAYNTEFQGVMAGQKFKTADLSQHVFNHLKAIDHAQAARDFINNIRKKDMRGADDRPLVVLHGTARTFGGPDNPALAINPERTQKIHIDPEKVKAMMDPNPQTGVNRLQEGLKNGTIEKLPFTVKDEDGKNMAAYAYTSDGYETLNHPATRAWGYIGQDTAGNPALMEGQMKFHPDVAQHVRQVLGIDESPVRSNKILSGINTAAGEAKGMLLSFSPFHIVQEALRGALVGINPLKYDHLNINDSPDLQRGVRKGLVRNNYQAEDQYSTGFASHSKLISKIPGLNRVQNAMQSFLFDKYIPGLKDRAYLKLYQDVLTENPRLTPDQAAERAADMTNDTFGGQNWRKMGVTTAQQDFMRMTLLAPDWLISELKMLKRVTGGADPETVAISRRQMAIQVASIWAVARVLNMLATGQMHNEAPFGVAHKDKDGKEVVYSVRTLPTDIIHAVSDPAGFLKGRVNPLVVRPTIEALQGRDELGRRAPAGQQVTDLIKNVAPIVGQGIFRGNSLNPLEQVAKGLGGNVARYRTEAEKLADQYASDRMPSGPVEPENLAAHQKELALEDALRQGTITRGQLNRQVSPRRAEELIKREKMTPLQARFDRLPLSEALNVWAAATPTEKDQLSKQLWKKRYNWLKEHPAAERASEPVWRKLQDTYGDLR